MSDDQFSALVCIIIGIGTTWSAIALFLWSFGVMSLHHTWKLWPLWTGPIIIVGAPFIAVALYLLLLPCVPCIFILMAKERRQQRAAHAAFQMEEGRRANARYIIPANAEAARVSADPLALKGAARPEEPRQIDGRSTDAEALPPTTDAKGNNSTPSDQCASTESPSGGIAEPQATETPALTPAGDTTGVIASPAPAHVKQ